MIATLLGNDDLWEIANQTWGAFLGDVPLLPADPTAPDVTGVIASVAITGAWDGHVVIRATRDLAVSVASALLFVDAAEVSDADLVDATGELANVVAGNVKCLLPQPSLLALPRVVSGAGVRAYWPSTTQICDLAATWHGQPVHIGVLQVDLS